MGEHRYLRREVGLGVALGVIFAFSPAVMATATAADIQAAANWEAASVKLEALAESRGALGMYLDKAKDQMWWSFPTTPPNQSRRRKLRSATSTSA